MKNTTQKNRYIAGIFILLVTLVTTYLVHTNSALNLADLTNTGETGTANDVIYVPTYTAGAGETGLIEIKTKDNITFFDSITFSLNYTPIDGLVFDSNPIVFDADTEFDAAAFQMTANPQQGKLIVTIVLNDPIEVTGVTTAIEASHKTLFKLDTEVSANLPDGQEIDISFSDFAILNGINPLTLPSIPASSITVAGQNELKVLNAESIDSTHVVVRFSDLISNVGTNADYTLSPALAVSAVEGGGAYGDDAVVLTTAAQTPGQEYVVTVDPLSDVESNQEGGVDANYSNVVFYGYGQGAGSLSDFALESASVTGYTTLTATFTDKVKAASVNKTDFSLSVQGGGAITINNVSSISNDQVVLTVATPLLKKNTYLLSVVTDDAILREVDSAELGIRQVAFLGAKNGPRLIGATVNNQNKVQLTFDENIQLAGVVNNPVGRLYTTGTDPGTLINDTNIATYNQVISGATLSLQNAIFNSANANFTFSVNDQDNLVNSSGVPVDNTYKTISFWGFGHNDATNSIGTIGVTKKDAVLIPVGSLNFNAVQLADVSVLYDSEGGSLSSEAISSVNLVGNNLEVVFSSSLNPDRHYVLRIVDDTISNTTLAAEDFVIDRGLEVAFAEAVSSTNVRVYFSHNIDERDVNAADFSINDGGIAVNSLVIDPGFESVLLTTAGPLSAGTIYKVTVTGVSDVYAFEGEAVSKNSTFFAGYQTGQANSLTEVSSISVIDSKTFRMTFSEALDENSVTPININVYYFPNPLDPSQRTKLVINSITKISPTVYEFKTAVQAPAENYFVIFNGFRDSGNLNLDNFGPPNFFGFELPKPSISLVTPGTLSNETEANVVLSGKNLNLVNQVKLDNQAVAIFSQSATSIVIKIPADFKAGLYDITLIDQINNVIKFNDALLVTEPKLGLTVHSDQSQAIPLSVTNDGKTKTKLWLLVEDPVGLASINSVVVDLSQIGGPSTVEMKKDTGTQPQYSQWYTYETTVPNTVKTKDEPYLLPVEIRKGNEKFTGTVKIRVTKDIVSSVAPVIDQAYITPLAVPPDNLTKLRISAQVTDQDGAPTISSVVANLGALGVGFVPLLPISEATEGVELETQFYQSAEFTVPQGTPYGTHAISVVASDTTGEKTTSNIQVQVTESGTTPTFNGDVSYISPRNSIPNDGKTQFSIHTQLTDLDGIDTVQSVVASFPTLGIAPVTLTSSGAGGKTASYSATGLTVPGTAPLGVHNIEIVASDSDGWMGNMILKLEVTHKDTLGDPPRIVLDRAYTTPRVAINDGKTPITIYAFVQDDDDDIESVVVNLSEIGQVGNQTSGPLGGATAAATPTTPSTGTCPTGSNVIVCMQPSVKEGDKGQWFILSNVTINNFISPSPYPYQVQMTVSDKGGKATSGQIPIYVGDSDQLAASQESPQVLAAIPTGPGTIEILFSKEMSASSILSSGKGFTISGNNDVNQKLPIVNATINPAGTIVTLTTGTQEAGKAYVLSVSNDIKDIVGRTVVSGSASKLSFKGFVAINRAPIIEYITSTDVDMIEVEFRDNIKPTSIAQSNIQIYESDDSTKRLEVLGFKVLAPGNVLQIQTAAQTAEKRYRLNLQNLASYDGTALPVALNKGFVGYNLAIAQHAAAANYADLNNDGRVDFADFTIFSSVYGTIYSGAGQNLAQSAASATSQAAQAGQALSNNPDALVPVTSPTNN